ncbi:MAG: DOPA 4,5-dioxygenase family protein [Haliangiales bacterium]
MTTPIDPNHAIRGYHAHVYYDQDTRDHAARLRTWIEGQFDARLGRWHDAPVGPHLSAMYQVAFPPHVFATLVPWLALNGGGLSILVHPETGDDLIDHTQYALWLGPQLDLNTDALR